MAETSPGAPPTSPTAAGRLLAGRYRLERRLARGGMADVWEGNDEVLARPVAVKVLHPHLAADAAFVTRFKREAVAAARLSHPGIVAIYDTCSDGDTEAIVMELVQGATVREVLDRGGALPPHRVVEIGVQVADALAHAHRAGTVHRDVKPANILLTEDGRVRVTDFGIAKAVHADGDLTDAGTVIGTAKYLSPEQVEGGAVDPRTDVYALGVVLYEMLTGAPPFEGETSLSTAVLRLHTDPLLPRQRRADVPRAVERVVLRAMARHPGDRYAGAADVRTALLALDGLDGPGDHDETTVVPRDPTSVAGAPARPTFAQTERSWLVPTMVILLVAGAFGVTGVVVGRTDVGRSILREAQEAVGRDVPLAPLGPPPEVTDVDSFDPQGDGQENDAGLPRLLDGDPSTVWTSERYDSHQDFRGLKDGIGVVLTLRQPARVDALTVRSPTSGWSASVYVASGPATSLDEWGEPVASVEDADGDEAIDLGGRQGAAVLLWITDLGDGEPQIEIGEVTLSG